MADPTAARKPFRGSCHCGQTKYIVFLTIPHKPVADNAPLPSGFPEARNHQELYRCNCTPCHKAGHFHMRLAWAPGDFLLLAPRDPLTDLGDYTCNGGRIHWFFCRNCGVRCFLFSGEGEDVEVDLDELGVMGKDGGKLGKSLVWRPKWEGWDEAGHRGDYLSVNGYTVDAEQEEFDLRVLTEKKCVGYVDCLELSGREEEIRYDRPHVGGAY